MLPTTYPSGEPLHLNPGCELWIVESAILIRGHLWRGRRHHDIIRAASRQIGWKYSHSEFPGPGVSGSDPQGFVTNRGNFVTREMGAEIALASGQIRELKFNQQELFSEDLY